MDITLRIRIMARRLNDFVLRGEIRNSSRNSVSGSLEVMRTEKNGDTETVVQSLVVLSLTGNLAGELEGMTFRFEVRKQDLPQPRPVLEPGFQTQQIGAMGDSVFRMVRLPLVSMEEFVEAGRRGETPPEEQRASIYLEWYSQNGRVVLELLDPKIEFEGNYCDLADPEPEAVPSPEDVGPPGITTIIRHEDGTFDVAPESGDASEPADDADPFSLFPEDMDEQIRRSASGTIDEPSPLPRDWDEVIPGIAPQTKAMFEEWDEVIYGTKDEPLTWLFEEPLCLPRPDDLRDEAHAWQVLSSLLTAMALRGVAFDMCPHFTAMRAYRLLIEDLLPRAGVHPNLAATGFVKHYCSWEHCGLRCGV